MSLPCAAPPAMLAAVSARQGRVGERTRYSRGLTKLSQGRDALLYFGSCRTPGVFFFFFFSRPRGNNNAE